MEIKYNIENDDYYRNTIIDTNFNFRFQKYSKYVSGILRLKKNGLLNQTIKKKNLLLVSFFPI